MVEIEINGFDESGNIGENLIFVRAGLSSEDILRPYVYNLLHFNSLVLTKSGLKGQSSKSKKEYVRKILDDPAIDVNFYSFPVENQLYALRRFTASEFNALYSCRGMLIEGLLDQEMLYEKASKVSTHLDRFRKPDKYIELFVKSYGHKMVIEDLLNTSKLLNHVKNGYKVISLVDGGYPFVFWAYPFLKQATFDGRPFSIRKTPVFGISNGDKYFPVINVAGNLASIANSLGSATYPHNIKKLPKIEKEDLIDLLEKYRKDYGWKKSFQKIFFVGFIPMELQYTIPFILYRNSGIFFEAFRVKYSFKGFKKEFGIRENDIIIQGEVQKQSGYEELLEEGKNIGLEISSASNYFDDFKEFLKEVSEEARLSTLETSQYEKIRKRIGDIENEVQKQIEK